MKISLKSALIGLVASLSLSAPAVAQHLTLEGQTGGFLTPTAYVVYTAKGHLFSSPAVGYHFINASKVIGNVQTFSIVEGIGNRAEFGYTRSVHSLGDSMTAPIYLSKLWDYDGMNIISGKVVLLKDGQGGLAVPGIAVGGLVRLDDHFVSGAISKELNQGDKGYTNGDIYIAATKTWLHPPIPLLVNLGLKGSNASIYGLGGTTNSFHPALFGGLGIPIPLAAGIVAVPSAGFTQEPHDVKGLPTLLPFGTHIPMTLDYAVRVTQKEHPHFSFDAGIGHVANNIGIMPLSQTIAVPINLQANKVFGMGLSFRY